MYRFLADRREALFAEDGPFARMRDLPLRFIYRHTKIYTAVMNTYLVPNYLRDGMDTSIQVDVLCRPLLHAELEPLLQADIPLFGASADSTALRIDEKQSLAGFFAEPGFDLLRDRFAKLSDRDMELQVSYIRSASNRSTTAKLRKFQRAKNCWRK